MSLKERYSYLAAWKKHGSRKGKGKNNPPVWFAMPGIPLVQLNEQEQRKRLNEERDILKNMGIPTNEKITFTVHDQIQKMSLEEFRKADPFTNSDEVVKNMVREAVQIGFMVKKIQDKVYNGKWTRERARDELEKVILPPPARGRKRVIDTKAAAILKKTYKELLPCIKEVREQMDVPLTKKHSNSRWDRYVEQKKDDIVSEARKIPGILDIFYESELPTILTKHSSIGEAAKLIIYERIKNLVTRPGEKAAQPFTLRSVKKILDDVV